MNTNAETLTLASRLVKAMSEIDAVTKTGVNQKQNYRYVKAADIANEVRPVMVKNGIAFIYDVVESKNWEKPTNAGGTLFFIELRVKFTFVDVVTGEQLSGHAIGWGADSMDKAPYKAMTGALKYILRMNFIIPDESDPENDLADINVVPERIEQKIQAQVHQFQPKPKAAERPEITDADLPASMFGEAVVAITEAQQKRLYAIAKKNGKSDADLKAKLATYGYKSSREIPRDKYEEICEWAEDASAEVPVDPLEEWKAAIEQMSTIDEFNLILPEAIKAGDSVKMMLGSAAKRKGFNFSAERRAFVDARVQN